MEILRTKFEHYRPDYYNSNDELYRYTRSGINKALWIPRANGGKTVCKITIKLGVIEATVVGEANCSDKDIFCYATGREIAQFRAMRFISAYKALENMVFNDNRSTETK